MITKGPSSEPGHVEVTFSVAADGHELPISMAGDFTGWTDEVVVLRPSGGRLEATVRLPAASRFEFRYLDARGRWFNDDGADDYRPNEWGGMNGIVVT